MIDTLLGLSGKTAIIWGGGLGMGADTARRLGEAGCRVAVVDVDIDRAKAVSAALCNSGVESIGISADATDEKQVLAAVHQTEQELGPIDVMATVVGIGVWSTLLEMSEEQLDEAMRLNLKTFFFPARAVARSMIDGNRPGAIVCVSSVSGLTSAPDHGGYGAAKAGVVNMVRTMAVEWGPQNVRVNAIAPGAIATPRIEMNEEARKRVGGLFPLGRPGETDEIAKAALFLLSDLSSYVTGHTLPVDGGWLSTFLTHAAGTRKESDQGSTQ